jgi:hypothetical protein
MLEICGISKALQNLLRWRICHRPIKKILYWRIFNEFPLFYLTDKIVTYMQGCQMACFQTKNPNLGKFWRVLLRKIFVYFMTIWFIYGHWKYFMAIWYILW